MMGKPEIAIALYRPKACKAEELEALVLKHFPILKECGLTTEREPIIGRSRDGTILEIFEWASLEAAKKAHDLPPVSKIWEDMAAVCDFGKLEQLAEATDLFPHFAKL